MLYNPTLDVKGCRSIDVVDIDHKKVLSSAKDSGFKEFANPLYLSDYKILKNYADSCVIHDDFIPLEQVILDIEGCLAHLNAEVLEEERNNSKAAEEINRKRKILALKIGLSVLVVIIGSTIATPFIGSIILSGIMLSQSL